MLERIFGKGILARLPWVVAIAVCSGAIGLYWAKMAPMRYAYRGLLEMASTGERNSQNLPETRAVVSPDEVTQMLDIFRARGDSSAEGSSFLKVIQSVGTSPRFLILVTEGPTAEAAQSKADEILSFLKKRYETVVEEARVVRSEETNLLRSQREHLNNALRSLSLRISKTGAKTDEASPNYLYLSLISKEIEDVRYRLAAREALSSPERNFNFRYITLDPYTAGSITFSRKHTALLGLALGGLIALAGAFILEEYSRRNLRRDSVA